MADQLTQYYGLTKPDVSGSNDTWGVKLNLDMDLVDTALNNLQNSINTVAAATATALSYLPVGIICLWNGSLASVPAGWQLCDGTNGTPNLRDKFVIGAGSAYAVNAAGGSASSTPTINVDAHILTVAEMPQHGHAVTDPKHTHTVNDPGHNHGVNDSGHSHGFPSVFNFVSAQAGAQSNMWQGRGDSQTYNSSAGINIQQNNTGITNAAAATGISIQQTGGGGGHTHTAECAAVPTIPPYIAKAFIMRV